MDSISARRGIILQKVRLLVVCVELHTDTQLSLMTGSKRVPCA